MTSDTAVAVSTSETIAMDVTNPIPTEQELMDVAGQGKSGPSIPRLKINRDVGENNDKPLPLGWYTLRLNDGVDVFSKSIRFQPLINTYQYQVYDEKENKFVCRTILFKNFKEEAVDTSGTVGCGRIARDKRDTLSAEELSWQNKIKCNRILFGLVSGSSTTPTGETIVLEDVPVIWKTSGVNFMPIEEKVRGLTKQNKPLFRHEFVLTTKREKKGSNIFYIASIDEVKATTFTKDKYDFMMLFQELINRENGFVYKEYERLMKKSIVSDEEEQIVRELSEDLNDKVDDI